MGQKEEYEKAMREQAQYCASFDPKVNEPKPGSRYTITDDFNYDLMKARIPYDSIYAPLGDLSDPNHQMIDPRDCEYVDCMHPCYGKNQYGACSKCVDTCSLTRDRDTASAICALSELEHNLIANLISL